MNLLRGRWSAGVSIPAPAPRRNELPEINAFVEIAVNGSRRRQSVPVEDITPEALLTRMPAGLRAGDPADFLYMNEAGRFRFATVCTTVIGTLAAFALPGEIKTIESFANRRAAPRLRRSGSVQWRDAPGGRGFGDFLPGEMIDISSVGLALVVARRLPLDAQVEVRFKLESQHDNFVAVAHVVRAAKLEKCDKSAAGIRFLKIDVAQQQQLAEFVNKQHQARRERGVV